MDPSWSPIPEPSAAMMKVTAAAAMAPAMAALQEKGVRPLPSAGVASMMVVSLMVKPLPGGRACRGALPLKFHNPTTDAVIPSSTQFFDEA
jgi:hypothetical protein